MVARLEEQVARNQDELSALTHTVDHIRHSLHLSDAQNLGLQVDIFTNNQVLRITPFNLSPDLWSDFEWETPMRKT